jgi:hypothetical protein
MLKKGSGRNNRLIIVDLSRPDSVIPDDPARWIHPFEWPWLATAEREPVSLLERDFHSERFLLKAACLEGGLRGHLPEGLFRMCAQAQPL